MATNRYTYPVPGATVGRTDQGVDFSGAPGTGILAITKERLAGTISNWYNGQPFYWFQQLGANNKPTGVYNYVAEQVSIGAKAASGKVLQAGQKVGVIAPSGTGLELGFATASGQTEAMATTGYTEGQQTASGQTYRAQVVNRTARPTGGGANTVNVPSYVPKAYVSWVRTAAQSTGLPASVVAAQINDESGFDPNATSSAGAEGIAQFLPSTFKSYSKGSPYNATDSLTAYNAFMGKLLTQYNGNIRNALAAYNAGPGNLQAGYGYADSILAAAGQTQSATAGGGTAVSTPITRPGGGDVSGSGSDTGVQGVKNLFTNYEAELNTPRTAPTSTFASLSSAGWKAPFQWWWQSFSGTYQGDIGG